MRRAILLITIVIFSFQSINAQVIQGTSNVGGGGGSGDIMFGVKAGLSGSTFLGSGFANISPQIGFYAGGIVEIPAFFENFYLQPELLFALQGADIGVSNLNLFYVHLPLMAKYHIIDEVAVEFGPQIGFLLSDNWDDPVTQLETNTINFGINIGAGYRMDENFYFQLRFTPGFTKIIDNTNLKNGVVQIGAAYFF